MTKLSRRLRAHRDRRAFNLAYDNASPTMRQELAAAAARSVTTR